VLDAPATSIETEPTDAPETYRQLGHLYSNGTYPTWSTDEGIDSLGPAPMSMVNNIFGGIAAGVFAWLILNYVQPGHRLFASLVSAAMAGLTAGLPIMFGRYDSRRGAWLEWNSATTLIRLPRLDFEVLAEDVDRVQLVFFRGVENPDGTSYGFEAELQLVDRRDRPHLICTACGGSQLRSTAIELGRIFETKVIEATETRSEGFRVATIGPAPSRREKAELSS